VKRRGSTPAPEAPPARLLDPVIEDWLDAAEVERAKDAIRGGEIGAGMLLAMDRVRQARRSWVRSRFPGLSEPEVTAEIRRIFSVPVPGRPDVAPRPALPRWSR